MASVAEPVRETPAATGGPVSLVSNSRLLDRYVLPKVAFAMITIASLAGTWLTTLTLDASPAQAFLKWVHMSSLALLSGGLMWQAWFISRSLSGLGDPLVGRFTEAQNERFRRWHGILAAVSLATAWPVVQTWLLPALGVATVSVYAACLVGLFATAFSGRANTIRPRMAWGLAILVLSVQAAADVRLQFAAFWPHGAWRVLHLIAFGAWYGGALWNIFVAVPSARQTACYDTVVAASRQLALFRKVVRVALPTIVLTGLLQSYFRIGLHAELLTNNPIGRLIVLKLGLIGLLLVVFITCPMWRACSPVAGVCNLEDLRPSRPRAARGDAP